MNFINILLVAMGGAVGSALRFMVSQGMQRWLGNGFPYGTLVVNLAGSLWMGVLMALLTGASYRYGLQALLAIGFLGGFTTFSAFAFDSLLISQQPDASLSLVVYIALSVLGALCFIGLGYHLTLHYLR